MDKKQFEMFSSELFELNDNLEGIGRLLDQMLNDKTSIWETQKWKINSLPVIGELNGSLITPHHENPKRIVFYTMAELSEGRFKVTRHD